MNMENLTALSYDLRKDVIDMICAGKAGHIGGDMSVMDTLVALYFNQMNVTPDNMDDPNHDRFVMSKGHSVEASVNSALNLSDIRTISFRESK